MIPIRAARACGSRTSTASATSTPSAPGGSISSATANPRINAAVRAQLDHLEHVIFAGFTHEPAVHLAEAAGALAPPGLNRCFFADNGSAAVEVALKMSFHYWRNTGRRRKTRFITLANSYHGETLGALAVGNVALYKDIYRPLLMDVISVPSPDAFEREPGESPAEHARGACSRTWKPRSREHHGEVAAVIVEPLVQCAGGMRMYDPRVSQPPARGLRRATACTSSPTRSPSASDARARCSPASRPASRRTSCACRRASLAATCRCPSCSPTTRSTTPSTTSTRSSTPSFTPTATPAIRWPAPPRTPRSPSSRRAGPRTQSRHGRAHARRVEHLRDHPHVAEIRQRGMILAIELVKDPATRTPWPWQERRGLRIYRHALERGALHPPARHHRLLHAALRDRARGDRPAGAHRHRRHRARMRVTRIYVEEPRRRERSSCCPRRRANT